MTGGTSILFVCEGNICRSPYALLSFQERWHHRYGVLPLAESAGTRAPVGVGSHPELRPFFRDAGSLARLDAHRSRPLDGRLIRAHDLIVTMERDQRRDVLDVAPAALRRTFSLGELACLSDLVQADDVGFRPDDDLTSLMARHRFAVAARGTERDISDPVHGGPGEFAEMAHAVDDAMTRLEVLLAWFDSHAVGEAHVADDPSSDEATR